MPVLWCGWFGKRLPMAEPTCRGKDGIIRKGRQVLRMPYGIRGEGFADGGSVNLPKLIGPVLRSLLTTEQPHAIIAVK